MSMSNILISLNGECSVSRNQLNKSYDYIFGVDGGTEFLYKLFFIPTHITVSYTHLTLPTIVDV